MLSAILKDYFMKRKFLIILSRVIGLYPYRIYILARQASHKNIS